jgi:hypothetical protein
MRLTYRPATDDATIELSLTTVELLELYDAFSSVDEESLTECDCDDDCRASPSNDACAYDASSMFTPSGLDGTRE